jgi:hypothetical protein
MFNQAKRAAIGETTTGVCTFAGVTCRYYPNSRRDAWFDKTGPIRKSEAENRLNDFIRNWPDDDTRRRSWQLMLLASASEFAHDRFVGIVTDIGASMISGFGDLYGWRYAKDAKAVELLFD